MPGEVKLPNLTLLIHVQHNPTFEDHLRDAVGLQELGRGEHGAVAIHNHRRRVDEIVKIDCVSRGEELERHAIDEEGEDLRAEEEEGGVDLE